MLNKDGVVMTVSLHKGVRYTVSFSTNDSGFAALVRGTYHFLVIIEHSQNLRLFCFLFVNFLHQVFILEYFYSFLLFSMID